MKPRRADFACVLGLISIISLLPFYTGFSLHWSERWDLGFPFTAVIVGIDEHIRIVPCWAGILNLSIWMSLAGVLYGSLLRVRALCHQVEYSMAGTYLYFTILFAILLETSSATDLCEQLILLPFQGRFRLSLCLLLLFITLPLFMGITFYKSLRCFRTKAAFAAILALGLTLAVTFSSWGWRHISFTAVYDSFLNGILQ